jgi:hypothetical protein
MPILMIKALFALSCAVPLTAVGLFIGRAIWGAAPAAWVPALAGAAAGMGIGLSGHYVLELWLSRNERPARREQ